MILRLAIRRNWSFRRKPRRRRGLRRKSNGCDTAKQKKKSHAGGAACGEGKGNLRGDKGGRAKGSLPSDPSRKE